MLHYQWIAIFDWIRRITLPGVSVILGFSFEVAIAHLPFSFFSLFISTLFCLCRSGCCSQLRQHLLLQSHGYCHVLHQDKNVRDHWNCEKSQLNSVFYKHYICSYCLFTTIKQWLSWKMVLRRRVLLSYAWSWRLLEDYIRLCVFGLEKELNILTRYLMGHPTSNMGDSSAEGNLYSGV